MTAVRQTRLFILLIGLLVAATPAAAAEPPRWETLALGQGVEMDLRVFPADGDTVVLGLPCDQGTGSAESRAAERLAEAGVEVWMADLLGAHFLPVAPSSMRKLEAAEVARVIQYVRNRTGDKHLYLVSGGYGAVPALRGARAWQDQGHGPPAGAILFFPYLYAEEPEPGRKPPYLPVVRETDLPVMVLQPALSSGRLWLERLQANLEAGGSRVQTRLLPGVRPFFYTSRDVNRAEIEMRERLHELVLESIETLRNREAEE